MIQKLAVYALLVNSRLLPCHAHGFIPITQSHNELYHIVLQGLKNVTDLYMDRVGDAEHPYDTDRIDTNESNCASLVTPSVGSGMLYEVEVSVVVQALEETVVSGIFFMFSSYNSGSPSY